mmetsp:Transcript_17323/g.44350  ORF Transcript_17323/g.44350 Transcript_17323/m.44350 type:complete len:185 (-) Transcript_17323:581-1135(-)
MRASRSRRLRPPGLPRWSCSCWLSTGSSRPLPEPPGPARGHFDMILLVKTPLDVACGLRARRYPMARWPGAGWPSAGNLWTTWASRIDSGRLPWCASADQARPRFEDAALSRLLGDGGGCAFNLLDGGSLAECLHGTHLVIMGGSQTFHAVAQLLRGEVDRLGQQVPPVDLYAKADGPPILDMV